MENTIRKIRSHFVLAGSWFLLVFAGLLFFDLLLAIFYSPIICLENASCMACSNSSRVTGFVI